MTTADCYYHHRFKINESEYNSHGGMTFGWIFRDSELVIAIAKCSIKDRYNKKIGKQIVDSRLDPNYNNSDFVLKFNKEILTKFVNEVVLIPKCFINPISFEVEDLSNTFIISFVKFMIAANSDIKQEYLNV